MRFANQSAEPSIGSVTRLRSKPRIAAVKFTASGRMRSRISVTISTRSAAEKMAHFTAAKLTPKNR